VYKPKRPPDRRYPEKEGKKRKEGKKKKSIILVRDLAFRRTHATRVGMKFDAEGNKGTKLGTRRDKACELQVANYAGGLNGKMA